MHKSTKHHKRTRHNGNGHSFDIYGDLVAIKDALADATYDVKGKASQILADSYINLRDKSADMQEGVSTLVAKKPFKSMGAMFVAGIALGYLLRRK